MISGIGQANAAYWASSASAVRQSARATTTAVQQAPAFELAPQSKFDNPLDVEFDAQFNEPFDAMTAARAPLALEDIQQVAARAGYVGVSSQDIQRAYTRGESLLVDYSV
ncbi:MAG: hypothetical protein VKJ06_09035 [Vampirovibrionales bacterium]|nr:hypothetical protein [Vampirovibrionales bacterium]